MNHYEDIQDTGSRFEIDYERYGAEAEALARSEGEIAKQEALLVQAQRLGLSEVEKVVNRIGSAFADEYLADELGTGGGESKAAHDARNAIEVLEDQINRLKEMLPTYTTFGESGHE